MSKRDNLFGFLLFSGIVVLTTCKVNWMKRSTVLHLMKNSIRPTLRPIQQDSSTFGLLISTDSENFRNNVWKSMASRKVDSNGECELEIVNELNEPIILCWVDERGNLHNHYPINDRSIKDRSVSNTHVEYTFRGHCFVAMKKCIDTPKCLKDVPDDHFVFLYVPEKGQSIHKLTLNQAVPEVSEEKFSFFGRKKLRTQPTNNKIQIHSECIPKHPDHDAIIDTTLKTYHTTQMHGFQIKYEPNVLSEFPAFRDCLQEDLCMVTKLLPPNACRLLQQDTIFWINKSIIYGKKSKPIVGRACTFHPRGGASWLANNGLSTEKEGCIEFMCIDDYMQSRHHWGIGGVLLHELCHAFHNKCCEDGFDNAAIRIGYEQAMEKQLYHAVKVHGPQGEKGLQKAYACTNCMEYFAELSVAYHWKENATCEYNKWFPFNRKQLQDHDPDSFQVLDKCWKQYE